MSRAPSNPARWRRIAAADVLGPTLGLGPLLLGVMLLLPLSTRTETGPMIACMLAAISGCTFSLLVPCYLANRPDRGPE